MPQDILWPFNPPSNRDKKGAGSLGELLRIRHVISVICFGSFFCYPPWSGAGTSSNICTMKCQTSPWVFCRTALIKRVSRIFTRNMSNDISWVSHFSSCLMQDLPSLCSGNFTIFLLVQGLIHFGIICLALMLPSKYCYKAGNHEACRYDREILKIEKIHLISDTNIMFIKWIWPPMSASLCSSVASHSLLSNGKSWWKKINGLSIQSPWFLF